jgi:hypothetical protein
LSVGDLREFLWEEKESDSYFSQMLLFPGIGRQAVYAILEIAGGEWRVRALEIQAKNAAQEAERLTPEWKEMLRAEAADRAAGRYTW